MRARTAFGSKTAIDQPVVVVSDASGATAEHRLEPGQRLTIGRDETSDILLDSGFVSKQHAVIHRQDGAVVVEDLSSANGTRVNGRPVSVSTLEAGDVIEIGDRTLVVRDAARRVRRGLGKRARLGLAAALTLVIGAIAFVTMLRLQPAATPLATSDAGVPGAAPAGVGGTPAGPAGEVAVRETPLVRRLLDRAELAGLPADAVLFDEGMALQRAGRLRQAAEVLAVLAGRHPEHPLAAARLAEVRAALDRAIGDHLGAAERAYAELRFDDAAREWERALALLEPDDPRAAAVRDGIRRAADRVRRTGRSSDGSAPAGPGSKEIVRG